MTSPKFLNWLSKSRDVQNPKQAAKHIHGLSIIARDTPELAPSISEYLKTLSEEESGETEQQKQPASSRNLESLSDQELLQQFGSSNEVKNLSDEQLQELSNLYEAMHPVQQ
jgi:cytochrome c553